MRRQPLSVTLALVTALAPSVAASQDSAPLTQPAPRPVDVALQEQGVFVGQLVSESGQPAAGATVTVTMRDGRQGAVNTNEQGAFAFRGVQGVATVSTDRAFAVVRAWAPGTQPPSATQGLLLVESDQVVRGQHYAGTGTQRFVDKSKRLFANPLFVAGVVATAVAIPVAIANDDDDPAS